jgi:hypothetical protein
MMGLANILAVLTPREKWEALRAVPTEPLLDWWIWVPAVLAVAAGVGLVALYRHWSEGRQSARRLEEAAKTLGLDAEERVVLARVATASGVQHPQTVLTSEAAFNRGVARAAEARVNLAASEQSQQDMVALVKSVRGKLGYEAIANTVAP